MSSNGSAADDLAINAARVSKTYKIWSSPAARLRAPLLNKAAQLPFMPRAAAAHLKGKASGCYRTFAALQELSFSVRNNETVGIVGRNGSGKSTLLQIIAGILTPTTGTLQVNGRVAALLELGSGFNPEFTGRENVYLNAAIVGLTRDEIDDRYPAIASFADIGEFIDHPVKTYSSGMYVRLAFAAAINTNADILIVDEALSVGDEAFQRKCFARIRAFQEKGGTILFVSHGAGTIVELCNRALLLERGELLMAGSPRAVVTAYHKLLYSPPESAARLVEELRAGIAPVPADPAGGEPSPSAPEPRERPWYDPHLVPTSTTAYESRGAVIGQAGVFDLDGRPANVLVRREEYVYRYSVRFSKKCSRVRFGMLLKTVSGLEFGGAVSAARPDAIERVEAGTLATVRFRFRCFLMPGTYFLNAGVVAEIADEEVFLHRIIDLVMIRVQHGATLLATGIVDLSVVPEVTFEADAPDSIAAERDVAASAFASED
jgi:lipopolysaccharide transport system ATP-binding protein